MTDNVAWSPQVTENARALHRLHMAYYHTPSAEVIASGANNLWEWLDQHGVKAAHPEGPAPSAVAPPDEIDRIVGHIYATFKPYLRQDQFIYLSERLEELIECVRRARPA